jgi:hypothetical protein
MTQDIATISATPTPTASAGGIVKHLREILQRIRSEQTRGTDAQPGRPIDSDPYAALLACVSVSYVDADEKWRAIASDPKAIAMLDEIKFHRDDAEYDAEIICSEDVIKNLRSEWNTRSSDLNERRL